jgi:hypothetical protein
MARVVVVDGSTTAPVPAAPAAFPPRTVVPEQPAQVQASAAQIAALYARPLARRTTPWRRRSKLTIAL